MNVEARLYKCGHCRSLFPYQLHVVAVLEIENDYYSAGTRNRVEHEGWCDDCYEQIKVAIARYKERVGIST